MHESYSDIINRIAVWPLWWDEHAVPRYCEFSPRRVANIYAREAALVLIRCQLCGKEYRVAFSWSEWEEHALFGGQPRPPLSAQIRSGALHFGDPPNACGFSPVDPACYGGATMNCEDIRVVEFWSRGNEEREWRRDPALELDLPDARTPLGRLPSSD